MWYMNRWFWAGCGFVAGTAAGWGGKVLWDKQQAKKAAAAPATAQASVSTQTQAQATATTPAPAPVATAPTIQVPIPPPSSPVATGGESHPSAPHAVALVDRMQALFN